MLSAPPAMMQSANPAMIRSAAEAMVCRPDEQKRLTVWAGTWYGTPAFIAATRAMFIPCSPSGKAQPMMMSSTSSGSIAGPVQQPPDGGGGQIVRPDILQFSLFRLAAGSAVGGQDICVSHV